MIKANQVLKDGVSVVIPFYNRSKFLKRLLDSIEAQTLSPEKIFIVDNGSSLEETNTAWYIIQSHKLFFKCSFSSSMKSGNANYARNLGYYLSETKYVAFLDSDDWWESEHLFQSIQSLKKSNKIAVYSGAIAHRIEGTVVEESINIDHFNEPFSLILSSQGYLAQTSSYVINKNKLGNTVVWDEGLKRHQDFDYFAAIFYQTSGWCYCPKVNVNIDWSHTNDKNKVIDFKSMILFYKKWNSLIPEHIKKIYLLNMLYYAYRHNSETDIKFFYHNELAENRFFDDWGYRIRSNILYVKSYINAADTLDKLGLKKIVKDILSI